MKLKVIFLLLASTVLIISCKNKSPEAEQNSLKEEEIEKVENKDIEAENKELVEKLQGKWREPEYPFRTAEFKDSTVKFIEEGVVEAPRFKEFELSVKCPFISDNSQTNKVVQK